MRPPARYEDDPAAELARELDREARAEAWAGRYCAWLVGMLLLALLVFGCWYVGYLQSDAFTRPALERAARPHAPL